MTLESPDTPRQQNGETVSPQNHAANEGGARILNTATVLEVGPPPEHSDNPQRRGYKTLGWWKDRLEVIAILAGVFYAVVTYCQWKDLRRNFVVSERAWVGVDRPVAVSLLTENQGVSFIVTTKNFGNSVAISVGTWAEVVNGFEKMKPSGEESCAYAAGLSRVYGGHIDNRSDIDWPKNMSSGVLFPNDSTGRHFKDTNIRIGSSPRSLIVVGCIVYRDQFGEERRTRFCYEGTMDPAQTTEPTFLYQCQLGENDAN